MLDYLPDAERRLVKVLRALVLDTIPEVTEKLSYNVPYYHRHQTICYIWPHSIPWGKVKPGGVKLGFSKGNLLNDDSGYLERESRKQVYTKTFFHETEIDPDLVRSFLYEAVELDDQDKVSRD